MTNGETTIDYKLHVYIYIYMSVNIYRCVITIIHNTVHIVKPSDAPAKKMLTIHSKFPVLRHLSRDLAGNRKQP